MVAIPFFGLFILFFGLVIVMIVVSSAQAKQRRLDLTQWALRRKLRFSSEKQRDYDDRYPFNAFKRGSSRYAYNIMQGSWNQRGLQAFDYHYTTRSTDSKGRSKTTHHYFSAILLSSALPLKPLAIRPENFFDKITGSFGFDDIDFESAAFSRAFHVKAADKRWAYDVIHPQTMEFLMRHPGYSIEFGAREVMVHYGGKTWTPPEFEQAIGVAEGLLDRLPDYLRKN